MRISVIVPYQKGALYLKDCLDSLCDQKFKDFEVILVNDHSEDNLDELLSPYQGRLSLVCIELKDEKTGVSAARNMGMEAAGGEYLYFLDSDDYLAEDALASMLQLALDQEAELVYAKKNMTWYKRDIYKEKEQVVDVEETDSVEGSTEEPEEEDETKHLVSEIQDDDPEDVVRGKKRNTAARLLITRKKDLQSISILNILLKKSLLVEHAITFHDDIRFFSDLSFVCEVLYHAQNVEFEERVTYIKRKHNDPINMPALVQDKGDHFDESLKAYHYAIDAIDAFSDIRIRLDKRMIHYYVVSITPQLRKNTKKLWRETRFQQMREIVENMNEEVICSVNRYRRKLCRYLLKGDVDKTVKAVARHSSTRMLAYLLTHRSELKKYLYRNVFAKKPVLQDTILFESFFGKSYSDSPKYIYEYLNENYPGKFRYVWIMNDKKKLPFKTKQAKRFSFRYYYYLARCKYIVFNSRQPKYFIKRKGNMFLETWHGTPLKKLVFDMEEVTTASPLYKEQFYIQQSSWDYLVAANEFSAEVFRHAFMYSGKMLKFGYPRNDILHRPDKDEVAAKIKERLGIPKEKKTILYAPTWRDDEYYGNGKYKFSLKLNLSTMRKRLGDDYVILLRTHYFIADSLDIIGMEGFVYNLSKYDDIAELYLISDILITDYSSVFFDYANLKRPMIFYTYDLDKYRDVLRGFYIDMEKELPGPMVYTTEEVIDQIENIDEVMKENQDKYDTFYEKYCGWEDGHATEHVVKKAFQLD